MGGTALGIEVDVRDYEPVEAMVARYRKFESGSLQLRFRVSRDFALPRREAGFRAGLSVLFLSRRDYSKQFCSNQR